MTAASIAVLAACGDDSDETTTVPEDNSISQTSPETDAETEPGAELPVVGNRWVIDQIATADATIAAAGLSEQAHLEIDQDGQVSGHTSCNGFGGTAEVGVESITFQQMVATKKGCMGESGQLDSTLLAALSGEVAAEVNGETLTLTAPDGQVITLTAGGPVSSATSS